VGSANQFLFLDEEKGYDFGIVMATNTDTSIVKQQEWDLDLALCLLRLKVGRAQGGHAPQNSLLNNKS